MYRYAGSFLLAIAIGVTPAIAAEPSGACALLTTAELEAALGAKVSPLKGGSPTPSVQMCSTKTPAADILIRVAQRKGGAGSQNAAAEGLKIFKDMGATVDVKTFGALTCSTVIPPKNMEQYGFNTTCSVVKGNTVGAIEVTAKTRKDHVSIEKLRPLGEKLASRLH